MADATGNLGGSTGLQHGARQGRDLQSGALGSQHLAQLGRAASAGTKRRAARWAIGSRSSGKSIKNYQAVVPTTWNAGPRDAQGQRGAYEASLLNTPVADPDAAARDSAHHSFLRSLHRLRGACDRCTGKEVYTAEGGLTAKVQRRSSCQSTTKHHSRTPGIRSRTLGRPIARVRVAVSAPPVPLGDGAFDRSAFLHRLLHPRSVHRRPGATIRS